MTDVADPEGTTMADLADVPASGTESSARANPPPSPTAPLGASGCLDSRSRCSGSGRS